MGGMLGILRSIEYEANKNVCTLHTPTPRRPPPFDHWITLSPGVCSFFRGQEAFKSNWPIGITASCVARHPPVVLTTFCTCPYLFLLFCSKSTPWQTWKQKLGENLAFLGSPERDQYLPVLPERLHPLLSSAGVHGRGRAPRPVNAEGESSA